MKRDGGGLVEEEKEGQRQRREIQWDRQTLWGDVEGATWIVGLSVLPGETDSTLRVGDGERLPHTALLVPCLPGHGEHGACIAPSLAT